MSEVRTRRKAARTYEEAVPPHVRDAASVICNMVRRLGDFRTALNYVLRDIPLAPRYYIYERTTVVRKAGKEYNYRYYYVSSVPGTKWSRPEPEVVIDASSAEADAAIATYKILNYAADVRPTIHKLMFLLSEIADLCREYSEYIANEEQAPF